MGNQSSSRFNRSSTSSFGEQQDRRSSSLDYPSNRVDKSQQQHRHKSDVDTFLDYPIGNKKNNGIYFNHHHAREHKRHGVVSLKVVNQHAATANLRGIENHICHTITPKGSIIYGASNFNPVAIQDAFIGSDSGYQLLPPDSFTLLDNRAHKVLVSYCNGWHVIPFPEVFSRHSGTCLVLGDRTYTSPPFHIKTGDCFRLGSVGLVVSEMRGEDDEVQKLDARTLEFLKDEALAFDAKGELALSATEEAAEGCFKAGDNDLQEEPNSPVSPSYSKAPTLCPSRVGSGGINPGERFVCYMCYENHDTEEDALVAPCDCKGDTRYLHVQCLQKWYQSTLNGQQAQVIRTTGSGSPACKICGAGYKTGFRKASGRIASILEIDKPGPYLCLVVVTKHDTNPGLFNTKFRLNFQSAADHQASFFNNPDDMNYNSINIGRSSACNMVLDYRTVSTYHAKITYEDGKFYLKDRLSSNGSMVYLRDPFPLSYSCAVKLRMGRTTISLQAKRNWSSTVRNMFGPSLPATGPHAPSPEVIQRILLDCMTDPSKAMMSSNNNSTTHPPLSHMVASSSNTLSSFRTIRTFNDDNDINHSNDLSNRRSPSITFNANNINAYNTININRPTSFHATQLVSMRSQHLTNYMSAQHTNDEVGDDTINYHESDNYRYNSVSAHIHALSSKISEQLMDLEEVLAERRLSTRGQLETDTQRNNFSVADRPSDEYDEYIHGNRFSNDDLDETTLYRSQRGVSSSSPVLIPSILLPSMEDVDNHISNNINSGAMIECDVLKMEDGDGDNVISRGAGGRALEEQDVTMQSHQHVLRSQSASPSRSSSSTLSAVLPMSDNVSNPSTGNSSSGQHLMEGVDADMQATEASLSPLLPTSHASTSIQSQLSLMSLRSRVNNHDDSCEALNNDGTEDLLYTSFPTAGAFTLYGQQYRSHTGKSNGDS